MNVPFQIRQLAQYPLIDTAFPGTVALVQMGGAGAPYASILASDLVGTALAAGGRLELNPNTGAILFGEGDGAPAINLVSGEFVFSLPIRTSGLSAAFVDAPSITVNGVPVVTVAQLAVKPVVSSFNFRTGGVLLELPDILRAGGAPIRDAHFGGWITAPSVWDTRANDDTVATANWVHRAIHDTGVSSFNCRTGDVVLQTSDVNAAYAVPGPPWPTSSNPALGDASSRIATTLFVDESLQDLHLTISDEQLALLTSSYAPLASPQLTGIPTAPTANPGTSTGQLATTAFVMQAVAASTTGVSSFNTRTGAVTLQATDISGAGGALSVSPAFTGTPVAPTAPPGNSTTQLATTAFVAAAVTAATAGVSSFNTRTGAVVLSLADVTGTNVLSNTALTGVPTAPTAAPGTSTTQLATTAFVQGYGVSSFMSRTGVVTLSSADVSAAGGALVASPAFTGTPSAPTAAPGTNTTQLATTQFVTAALVAVSGGVSSFNTRTGAVTLTLADVTGVGGAPLASPVFTGVPAAPTPVPTDNSTALATTAFVQSLLTGWQFSLSAATAWNPADTTANMTLSNGNLTATSTNFSVGTRAAVGLSSGKSYFEVTMATGASTADNVGLATAAANLTTTGGAGTTVVINGNIFVNGTSVAAFPGIANGSIIGIAVDLTAQLIWYRIAPSGNWNNSGTANPATGAGGVSISALGSAALYPVYQVGAATGHSATANFGASAFSGAVPSGFISGWGTGISTATGTGVGGDKIVSQAGIQLVPGGSGTVTAPTVAAGNNSTAIATTAFVTSALGSYLPLAGGTMTGTLTADGTVSLPNGPLTVAHSAIVGLANVAGMSCSPANGLTVELNGCPETLNRIATTGPIVAFYQAGTQVGTISVTASATAYNTTSDGRLKTDLREFEAGTVIDRLKPWDFCWKANGHRGHGLVAQDTLDVYPEAVTHDVDKDVWGIDYSKFVPLLIAEIRALRMRVVALEAA